MYYKQSGSAGIDVTFNMTINAMVNFYSSMTNSSAKITLNWPTQPSTADAQVNTLNNETALNCGSSMMKQIVVPNNGKIYVLG